MGEATDIVQKEMYSFDDGGGRSLTLRPEGTAPICRAYMEHGMHKLPAPVKLWYLGPFFRHERAQAGRYRQFWQVGAEALGSDDPALDAELIVLLQTLLDELGVRELRLRLSSLGQPAARDVYREQLKEYLHAHADRLSFDVTSKAAMIRFGSRYGSGRFGSSLVTGKKPKAPFLILPVQRLTKRPPERFRMILHVCAKNTLLAWPNTISGVCSGARRRSERYSPGPASGSSPDNALCGYAQFRHI